MDEYYNVIGPGYWLYYRWKVFVLGFAVVRLVLVSDIFDSPHFIFRGFRVCPACLEVFTCYMFTHKIKEMHAPFARKAATRDLSIYWRLSMHMRLWPGGTLIRREGAEINRFKLLSPIECRLQAWGYPRIPNSEPNFIMPVPLPLSFLSSDS